MIMMKIKRMVPILCMLMIPVIFAAGCSDLESSTKATESYEELIFDTARVHMIEVNMSEEDRADQMANPTDKAKYKADVVIDGEEIKDVAFYTKGNSSLFFTAEAGKDKFSYKLNFGKYTEDGNYHGLDKLNLQNNIADGSMMKEYMVFWLFHKMGIDAPLASYVWLTVNGEDQGLYTAIEEVGESFLERMANGEGTLYKPEDGEMALNKEEMERITAGVSAAHDSNGGADLIYKDDNDESYPDIFDNAETDEDKGTRARVIRSLKALSERKDLDKYLDTEEIIKYFAVHDYLVNYDSYTGPMLHNYYLYENDGRLAMLPWDYDNSFGSFPQDASLGSFIDSKDVVNAGVDSPLGKIADEERPMWNWILSDKAYQNEYHDRLSELLGFISSGEFAKEAGEMYDLILPYTEKDPKAFYNPEEFKKAYSTVLKISELRAESVRRQLNGQLAARSEDQAEEDKVDASGIFIKDMGDLNAMLQGNQ